MKTRTILCGIALMMSCAAANAQKTTSITLGVSPYGFAHSVVFWDKDHEYNYKYKPSIGANICFEKQIFPPRVSRFLLFLQNKLGNYIPVVPD